MFLTAGTTVKFHTWPTEDNESLGLEYKPCSPSSITQVSWCNDGNYLAVLPENGNPEIVSTRDKNCARLVHTVQVLSDVTSLAFQKTTKKYLALGSANAQIALYDTKHRTIAKLYTNLTSSVQDIDFNFEDHCMAAACNDGRIAVYGLNKRDACEIIKIPNLSRPTTLRFHPKKCNYLAVSTENGNVVLWDIITSKKIFHLQSHPCPITGLALTSDDAFLVTIGENHKMCVYDINAGECTFHSNLQEPLTAVDIMSTANCMAVGCKGGSVYLYDMRKLVQPVYSFQPHSKRINKILFSNQCSRPKPIGNVTPSKMSIDTFISSPEDLLEPIEGLSQLEQNDFDNSTSIHPQPDTTINYENTRKIITKALRYHISETCNKITEHFASLRDVMENEVTTLDTAIDEKCFTVANALLKKKENNENEKQGDS